MYAETGLLYPYFQSFSQDVQHLEEFCGIQKNNAFSMGNLLSTTTLLEYDMGAEGDLFKAPEPIITEPLMGLVPMSDTISMISNGNNDMSSQTIKVVDIETIQSEHLLSEVFYECRKDLLEKSAIGESFAEDPDVKIPVVQMEDPIAEMSRLISDGSIQKSVHSRSLDDPVEEIDRLIWEGSKQRRVSSMCFEDPVDQKDRLNLGDIKQKSIGSRCLEDPIEEKVWPIWEDLKQKSVSSGCLSTMEWIHRDVMRPNFSDFHGVDFGPAYGMRRAFSEGDIQTLNNGKTSLMHSHFERMLTIGNYTSEERMQKLSRYKIKKAKRNFGRTIKYACRKALAENQPRVRGRFAKTEESDTPKKSCKTITSKRISGYVVEESQ